VYRVNGKLIGISVIDVLPKCVSSVYFIWDPDWAWASLGKLSALREIALARDMREAGLKHMGWVYMGQLSLYVFLLDKLIGVQGIGLLGVVRCDIRASIRLHTYSIRSVLLSMLPIQHPTDFLLQGTNQFHALTGRIDSFLQAHPTGYHPFVKIESGEFASHQSSGEVRIDSNDMEFDEVEELDEWPKEAPPGFVNPASLAFEDIQGLMVMMKGRGVFKQNRLVKYKVSVHTSLSP
jgi:arginine-tRNA-protein transferase